MRLRSLLLSLLMMLAVALPALGQWSGIFGGTSDASRRALPPAYAANRLELEIPFSITPGSDPTVQPSTVRIYVSWDHGRNWHKYTDVPADAGKFRFRAKKDAEFWFVTRTIDAQGREPRDRPNEPQLRLIIDTQKPQLQVTPVMNPEGRVEVTFSATDPQLNAESFKLEYQPAGQEELPWEAVSAAGSRQTAMRDGLMGKTNFAPPGKPRAINVRAEVRDVAGNVSYFAQQVVMPRPTSAEREALTQSPLAMEAGARRWPSDNRTPYEGDSGPQRLDPGSLAHSGERDEDRTAEVIGNPHAGRDRLAAAPKPSPQVDELKPPRDAQETVEVPPPAARRPSSNLPMLPPPSDLPQDNEGVPELSAPLTVNRPDRRGEESLPPPREELRPAPRSHPAGTDIGPLPADDSLPPPQSQPGPMEDDSAENGSRSDAVTSEIIPAGTRPRLTNTRRFSLDYDVDAVGPEGIAEVELWGTSDGGRTWLKWGSDPDRTSPMDVEVGSEATYGFRVVIVGKNGLEGNKPAAGDDADIWVTIDATQPAARITAAGYGQGLDAGKLDIHWEASDAHLGPRPVTLLYCDRPDGKFSVIAAGLDNSGQYLWQFDPRSPRKIYLRLEVRDDAGNIGIHQLAEPINVEGLIPQGRIRSLTPAPEPVEGRRQPFRSPLFR